MSDQREASGRPDVVTFVSDVLTAPVKIAGQPGVGGYQLMVAADIFRGRYRESLETPTPIAPNQSLHGKTPPPKSNAGPWHPSTG